MIHTVVNYLFNGIETRDGPWLLVLVLAITHVSMTWLRNAFGKRRPARKPGPSSKRMPIEGVEPARDHP
jgi:hypothetical protein